MLIKKQMILSTVSLSLISLLFFGVILSIVFGVYLTQDFGNTCSSPSPSVSKNQSFDLNKLNGPSEVTENAIVRWSNEINNVQDSSVIVEDDGSISIPGNITAQNGVSKMNNLTILQGSKGVRFNLSAVPDNTVRTIIMPNSNANLGIFGTNVVTVPGDYDTIILAMNAGASRIEVISNTQETTELTNGSSSFTNLWITIAQGVIYDWKNFSLSFSIPDVNIRFIGLGNTTDITSTIPSTNDSTMKFEGQNKHFIEKTNPGTVTISMTKLNIQSYDSATKSIFNGNVIQQLVNVTVYFPGIEDIYKMGSSPLSIPGFCRDSYFFQTTGTGISSVIHAFTNEIVNTWFVGINEIIFDTINSNACVLSQSKINAKNSVISNITSLNSSSIELDDNCSFTDSTTSIDIILKGNDVKVSNALIENFTFDNAEIQKGNNLSISSSTLNSINLSIPSVSNVLVNDCIINISGTFSIASNNTIISSNIIKNGSFLLQGESCTLYGNIIETVTCKFIQNNHKIVGNNIVATSYIVFDGNTTHMSSTTLKSPDIQFTGYMWKCSTISFTTVDDSNNCVIRIKGVSTTISNSSFDVSTLNVTGNTTKLIGNDILLNDTLFLGGNHGMLSSCSINVKNEVPPAEGLKMEMTGNEWIVTGTMVSAPLANNDTLPFVVSGNNIVMSACNFERELQITGDYVVISGIAADGITFSPENAPTCTLSTSVIKGTYTPSGVVSDGYNIFESS